MLGVVGSFRPIEVFGKTMTFAASPSETTLHPAREVFKLHGNRCEGRRQRLGRVNSLPETNFLGTKPRYPIRTHERALMLGIRHGPTYLNQQVNRAAIRGMEA